ncbi:30S ribosomal protein S6 [Candidatus Gracilibacteria bacterium]|nr:30S ribosomal protein S6 [Candidatus Gracilibacteria bacterium]MCF7819755.1 30S ribosomal protein S6 [Candidatus Gracilibacteria bacterium]
MTQKYEILAIIVNSLDEKAAAKYATEHIVKKIKDEGGNVTFEDFWGERGFAYTINKQKWGYYFCAQFECEPQNIDGLKHEWNLDNTIVRFLITKVPKNAPKPQTQEEMEAQWAAEEKEQKIKEVATKTAKSAPKKPAPEKTPKVEEKEEKSTKEEKPKPKKDVIDKKLDEILEDSSLDL